MSRPTGMRPILAGAIALAVIAVACVLVFTGANPFADRFTLRAAFANIDEVRSGSLVRIAGVNVGTVAGTQPGPSSNTSVLELELEDTALPLHRDLTLRVRPRIFLEGNHFVEISPGSPSAPELPEGTLVPATQTAASVSAGDFLRIFKRDTREDVRTVLDELGTALGGGGAQAFNRATRYWERAFRDSARVSEAARGLSGQDLSRYVREAARVAEGLSRDPDALQDLVAAAATASDALAREQESLTAAVDELPTTLRRGYSALGAVNDALPDVRVLARELTPAVRSSPATLDAALPLARELRRLVAPGELGGLARDLRGTARPLARFVHGSIDLQELQRQVASCQNRVVLPTWQSTVPDPNFPSSGPVYEEFAKWLVGVAGGGRSFDANGIYSRTFAPSGNFVYPVGNRFLYNTQPLRGVNPPPMRVPPFRPGVPCETQDRPDLRSTPAPVPEAITAAAAPVLQETAP